MESPCVSSAARAVGIEHEAPSVDLAKPCSSLSVQVSKCPRPNVQVILLVLSAHTPCQTVPRQSTTKLQSLPGCPDAWEEG